MVLCIQAVLKGDSGLDVDKELVALQQQRSVQLFRLPTQHRDAAAVPYQEYYSVSSPHAPVCGHRPLQGPLDARRNAFLCYWCCCLLHARLC